MATEVQYNGVTMHNVQTESWAEEVTYDDSGSDRISTKYSLRFTGVLHAQRAPIADSEAYTINDTTQPNVFSLLNAVKGALEAPKRNLIVTIAGSEVINIVSATVDQGSTGSLLPANVDVSNGPKPQRVEVTPVGSSLFRISFEIEAETSDCGSPRSGSTLVLSNRWSLAESMDGNYAITRLIRGTMRIAGSMTSPTEGVRAFGFKGLTIPPLEDSFKRDAIAYTVEPDGLTVRYEVVDRQVHTAAPWPATRISGQHTEAVQSGTFFVSDMSIQLEGDPAVDKRLLVERALQILDARLNFARLKSSSLVESFIVSDDIGDNASVSASARIKQVDVQASLSFGTLLREVGKPLSLPALVNSRGVVDGSQYNSQLSRVPSIHGYKASSAEVDWSRSPLVTWFLHVYAQSPCSDEHQVGPTETVSEPRERTSRRSGSTSISEVPYSQPVVDQFNSYSKETAEAIYTVAEMSSRYHSNHMVAQMPIASDETDSASSALITLSGPQCYRYVEINAERVGREPAIPQPVSEYSYEGVKAVLKAFDIEMLAPVRSPDGRQRIERRIAKYLYLLDRMPDFSRPLPVGVNPVTNLPGYSGRSTLNLTGDMGSSSTGSFINS